MKGGMKREKSIKELGILIPTYILLPNYTTKSFFFEKSSAFWWYVAYHSLFSLGQQRLSP